MFIEEADVAGGKNTGTIFFGDFPTGISTGSIGRLGTYGIGYYPFAFSSLSTYAGIGAIIAPGYKG